ncbi:MAG: UTP--glucose-1-phosphate uridylyltransferase [Candidatus Helarchaeota archaeon]
MKIKKAIIPSAGLGTRLLPATFAQPKEMLPVGRKPTIQYVVEELANAGISDILIITGRNKRAIEDHFDIDYTLLENLKQHGKNKLLEQMSFLEKLKVNIFITRQSKPTGLADAVLLGEAFIENEPFAVALGDTIIKSSKKNNNYLKRLCEFHLKKNSYGTIGVEPVSLEQVSKYGIIEGNQDNEGIYKVLNLIEKPLPSEAPSNLAINGRYVFNPEIFDCIKKTKIGIGNERQLTDSIRILLDLKKNDIWAICMKKGEKRYDIGNPLDYAKAFIELCLDDSEIKDDLIIFLKKFIKNL